MESIDLYECSEVPSGHPVGLRWRPAAPPTIVTGAATSTVEAVLRPYEVHHLPQPAT